MKTLTAKQIPWVFAALFALFLVSGNAEAQTIEHKPVQRPQPVQLPAVAPIAYCSEHMRVTYAGERGGVGAVLIQRIDGTEEGYTGKTSYSFGGKYQDVGFLVAVAQSERNLILFYRDRAVINRDGRVTSLPVCLKGQ
jgi:hypothetical protein